MNQQKSTKSTSAIKPEQAAMIEALGRGLSVTAAAKEANLDRTTFYLWQKSDPNFQAELNRAKQEQVDATRAQLRGLADTAVATVRELLTAKKVPPAVRLKAALSVLAVLGTIKSELPGKTDPEKLAADLIMENLITF